jgi:hypothetical protein
MGEVSLQPGDTADVNVAFIGVSVSSGTKEGFSVYLDDELRGYTPCLLESIPAGLHGEGRGEGFSPWQEKWWSATGDRGGRVKPGKLPATDRCA